MSFSDWSDNKKNKTNQASVVSSFSEWSDRKKGIATTTQSDVDAANAWIDRYNAAVKGIVDYDSSRNGRYTSDVSGGHGAEIDALIGDYERNRSSFDGFEMGEAYEYLKELQGYILEGNKPENKVVRGSPLIYGLYAQQPAVEKVLKRDRLGQLDQYLEQSIKEREERRKTTRDGATIQSELDEVNAQLQEAYKPVKRQEVFNTLGAIASNVLVSSSGLAPVTPQGAQITPDIIELERRKRELEEEQGWAQYFADEKYQQDSAAWAQKYAGQTYGQLQTVIEYGGLYGTDEYKWLQEYAPTTMTAEDKRQVITQNENEIVLLEAVLKEYEGLAVKITSADDYSAKRRREIYQQYGSEKDIRTRITELKDENWKLGNEIAYAFLEESEDFEEKSGYVTTARDVKRWENIIDPYNPGFGDLMYEYINNQPGARNAILKYFSSNLDEGDDVNIMALQKFSLMEPEEVKRYNYLYATQGRDAASDYLTYLTYELNARASKNLEKTAQEMAQGFGGGTASSVLSVPINLVSGVGLLDAAVQKLQNSMREKATGEYRPVDYNTTAMAASKVSSTIRGTVSGSIANATGTINMDTNKYPTLSKLLNGKSLGDVYQLGMSMADSAAVAAMAPVLGGAGTVLLGGSAGTQGMLDAVANGATDEQALTMGVLNGAFEMVFEKVSIDKLLDGSSGNIVKDILMQGITEGSEEAFTSIANTVADIVVMAEKSGWEQGIAAYMEQGMSREEAEKQAFWDVAIQIGWDFVGGMASGGIMGGSNYGINSAKQKKVDAQLQKVKEMLESQAPVNPVAEQVQQPDLDIDPDSAMGQILRNMNVQQQTQQPVFDPERDSVQAQILRHWSGEEQSQNIGTREQQEQMARLSRITGREVVLYEGAAYENGYFDRSDGKIYVNVNGVDPVVQTFSHELTHSTEGAKVYNELKSYVFDKIQQNGENLAQKKAEKIRVYESRGKHLDSVGAEQEIVAEYISQNLLTNEQIITEVCRNKPTVGRQILNWIDRFLAKLGVTSADRAALEHAKILYAKALNQTQSSFNGQTAAAKPTQRGSQQATADNAAEWKEYLDFRDRIQQELESGRITEREYDQYTDIADQWEQELQGKAGADMQHSIVELPDGKKYVRADRQVIFGNDPDSWSEQVEDYINGRIRRGKDVSLIAEDGEVLTITSKTAGKLADNHTGKGTTMTDDAFYLKANAAVHIDELAQVSTAVPGVLREDVDGRHGEFASGGWSYRTAFFQDFDGKYYRLRISAAKNADGTIVYNIGDVKERSFPTINGSSAMGGALGGKTSSKKTVPQDGADVKQQFSISDTSSKQDVVRGLKDILRRGGDLNELRQFVAQVEQNDPKAEQNAPRADQNTREAEHILQSAKRQGISVEEYLSQNWELYETENGWDPAARKALEMEKGDSRQYSFAGRNALTADDSLLASAEQMRAEGVDAETIRQETGWYVGKDGMWRFEIDDSQMELSNAIHNYMRLGDLIHHEKLFAAYPDLAYVQVTFENLPVGTFAQYNRQFDSIAVSNKLTDPDVSDAFKDALAHEIQHAIQNREGFTAGASPEGWNRKIERGFDSRRSQDIRKAQETEQKLAQIRQEQPEFYQAMMALEAMTPTVPRGEINWDTLKQIEEDPPEWQVFDARRDAMQEQYGDMEVWDFMDLIHDQKRLAQVGRTGVELYYDTAGEIEARNVEYRRGYSEEQRKNNPPRLGGEDTVLAEATRLNAQAIGRTTQNKPFVIIEKDILDGVPEVDWVKTVKGNLRNNYPNGITIGSNDIYIDSQSRKEMTYSKYMRWIKNNDPQVYGDKLRATNNADEILQATTGWVNEGLNHPRNDKIVEFARGDVLLRVGNNDYTAEVVVGKESNGKLKLYDLINLMPTTIVTKKTAVAISENPSPGAARNTTTIFDDTVAQGEAGVKQFSVGDTQMEAENQEATTDAVREQLPRKAQEYLKKAERKLLGDLQKKLGANKFADKSFLKDIVRRISDEYLETGTIKESSYEALFNEAYEQSIVIDREFYDTYKEVKKYLQTMGVTLAEGDRSNIPDWYDFRTKANKYRVLRIVDQGGLPVDTAYGELQTMAPGLFPESITHPADKLVHMYEVATSIAITEQSLNEYYGSEAEMFRKYAKSGFENAVSDVIADLREVRRVGEEHTAEEAEKAAKKPMTAKELLDTFEQLKKARRNCDKVVAKNLLSHQAEMQVGRLLKGEILPEHLDKETENVKGILAVYEAKKEYEKYCGQIAEYKRQYKTMLKELADSYLETAGEWKDKRMGILYSRETMRRNIFDIVKDPVLAEAICEEYFEMIHTAEAAANKFKTEYRDRVRALNLSTKARRGDMVSEAHAVQLLGEVQDNIRVLENAKGRIRQKDGKTLAEWRAVIDEMWQSSPSLDKEKIEWAVREFRYIYDQLFVQMNEVRVRNGYEPVNYRKGYFPHFQPGGDGIIAQFGKALGISTEVQALPTTINGLTHTFKPGIQWFGNAQERLGFNTAYDAVEGFDKYIEGVASVIHQTDNIQKLRALAAQVRYRTTDEGIRQEVDAIRARTDCTEADKDRAIAELYEKAKCSLSNFVAELDEYTNLLANKKSIHDRGDEKDWGRKGVYHTIKKLARQVAVNMVNGNFSSALTNFIPLTQASAQLDRFSLARGMFSALQSYIEDDGLVGMSTFLTNRRGSEPLIRDWIEKGSAFVGKPMEWIDTFVSDSIVRAAYFQNLQRGLSEAEAMHQADIFAAGVMADRSKGAMPTLFQRQGLLTKGVTQFQLEVNNQFSEVFKDIPRRFGKDGWKMVALVLLKYFVAAYIFDDTFEYLFGRRPGLDPIDMLNNFIGDLTGYKIPSYLGLFEDIVTGEGADWEHQGKTGVGQAVINLGGAVAEELPFNAALGLVGVEDAGGRIPVASAIPDVKAIVQAAGNTDWSNKRRWKVAWDELQKPLTYAFAPFAGGQISKTLKGLTAYLKGGGYGIEDVQKVDEKGNIVVEGQEYLQYPVYKDDPQDAFWNLVRATIMGKSALPEAQEWVNSGFDSFTAKQTAVYQALLDSGVKDREAFNAIQEFSDIRKVGNVSEATLQRQYIRESDLSGEGKAILYYSSLDKDDKDIELMDKLLDMGASPDDVTNTLMDIRDAEDGEKKRDILIAAPLTDAEKIEIYRVRVSDDRDDDIEMLQSAKIDFNQFLKIHNEYDRINKTDIDAQEKAVEFAHWVNEQGFTSTQAREINGCFKFFSMAPAQADRYNKAVSAGLDTEQAYEIENEIQDLEPLEGKTSVQDIQKWRICVDFSDNVSVQLSALYAVMGDTQYQKMETAYWLGVEPKDYVAFYEVKPKFDADQNGGFTNAEIKAAIDSIGGSLTNEQKAVLWQLGTGSKSAKNNPYDRSAGQRYLDAKAAEKDKQQEEESTLAPTFSEEIARQWG